MADPRRDELGSAETLAAAPRPSDVGTDETLAAGPAVSAVSAGTDETLRARERTSSAPAGPRRSVFARPEGDRYQRRGELARGGMGRIIVAHDRALDRTVALKELLDLDATALARFEREARITARLQHPSIVPLYEAGQGPDGLPYFAMKKVDGRSLDAVLVEKDSLARRVELLPTVLAVAEAMAYAHAQGVIHRDLKPLNVLVGSFGETVVIDWGIARDLRDASSQEPAGAMRPERDSDGKVTVDGSVIGTPAYMSPEQAGGEPLDERSDVYALGALLYEVLSGRAPYSGGSGWQVLAQVLVKPPPALEAVAPEVSRELAAITGRAMARSPEARYPNAGAFAEDLRRYLNGQLVGAHTYTARELLARWAKKNRGALLTGAAAAAALFVMGGVSVKRVMLARDDATVAARRAERARDEAERARARAVEAANRAVISRAHEAVERDPALAVAILRELDERGGGWSAARVIAADAVARGLPTRVVRLGFTPAGPPAVDREGRAAAVRSADGRLAVVDLRDGSVRSHAMPGSARRYATLAFRGGSDEAVVVTPLLDAVFVPREGALRTVTRRGDDDDGSYVRAVGALDPRASYRLAPGALQRFDGRAWVQALAMPAPRPYTVASGDGDDGDDEGGTQVAVQVDDDSDSTIQRLRILDFSSQNLGTSVSPARAYPRGLVALSPRGDWITVDGGRLFSARTGVEISLPFGGRGWIAFARSGGAWVAGPADDERRFVVGRGDGVQQALARREVDGEARRGSALSNDGALLVSPVERGVRLYDLRDPEAAPPARTLLGHQGLATRGVIDPRGRVLVTAGAEGTLRVWGADFGAASGRYARPADRIVAVQPDEDRATTRALVLHEGRYAVTRIGVEPAAPVVALEGAPEAGRALVDDRVAGPVFDRAGGHCALVDLDGRAMVWDASTGRRIALVPDATHVVFTAAGGSAVVASSAGFSLVPFDGSPARVAPSPAAGSVEGLACARPALYALLPARGAAALAAFACGAGPLRWAALSHDGARWSPPPGALPAAQVARQQRFSLVDPDTRSMIGTVSRAVVQARASRDGGRLAVLTPDGALSLTDLASGATRAHPTGLEGLTLLGFSDDGSFVAASHAQGLVVLGADGGPLRRIARDPGPIEAWAFAPDATRLLAVGGGRATLFDVASGERRDLVTAHPQGRTGVSAWFSRDGASVWWATGETASYADALFGERDDLPTSPADLRRWLQSQPFRVDEGGALAQPAGP